MATSASGLHTLLCAPHFFNTPDDFVWQKVAHFDDRNRVLPPTEI